MGRQRKAKETEISMLRKQEQYEPTRVKQKTKYRNTRKLENSSGRHNYIDPYRKGHSVMQMERTEA